MKWILLLASITWSLFCPVVMAIIPPEKLASLRNDAEIDLSCCGVTAEDVEIILGQLKDNPKLESLDLSQNSTLGVEGVGKVLEGLFELPNLKSLNLSRIYFGDQNLEKIFMLSKEFPSPNLKSLDLSYNKLGEFGIVVLSKILEKFPNLEVLKLVGNRIGNVGVCALASLKPNGMLLNLDLSNNAIGSYGVKWVAKLLEHNVLLRNFSLAGNNIRRLSGFSEGLNHCTNLVSLDLSRNLISDISALCKVLKDFPGLKRVDLACNSINDRSANALQELLESTSLEELNLSSNSMGCKFADVINDRLQAGTVLKELNLTGNTIIVTWIGKNLKATRPDVVRIDELDPAKRPRERDTSAELRAPKRAKVHE